jgi:lipopolysaccharide/colanic/teichoic acid biosynthesis glycosyltransferase
VSALALVLLSPLLLLIALLVKGSSPGPVLYETAGVGQQRRFVWRKFRSMRVLDPQLDQAARREKFRAFAQAKQTGKVIDAQRVTRVGAFLRKYSLDEPPQLWSVLKGEMTLVGPRPCLPYELEFFPGWAAARFQVRPGLTGVWQVVGRGEVTLEQGLVMDVYYVHARSFALDVRLALDTVYVMLRGEGDK